MNEVEQRPESDGNDGPPAAEGQGIAPRGFPIRQRAAGEAFEPREVCLRCRRPRKVCWCSHLTSIDTRTRVVLLQHTRERDVPIGTARMASLCLPNSELHVGVNFAGSSALAAALDDPQRPAALLYPSEGARDVATDPPEGPITLVVVDGTWWQAKKLIRENPQLAALPRLAFTPKAPSEYRIRREPLPEYVSTIEALVHVLEALEDAPGRFDAMLTPFRAMVDMQLEHTRARQGARSRHRKGPKPAKKNAMSRMRDQHERLVCVMAEANAWPYRMPDGSRSPPDEIVLWTAHRPATGETFSFVVRPEGALAPNTATRIGMSEEALLAGGTREELFAAWDRFIRPDDELCTWGPFGTRLFAASGGTLPARRFDVRQVARDRVQGKVGSMDDVLRSLGREELPGPLAVGRAGLRLARLAAIVEAFLGAPSRT